MNRRSFFASFVALPVVLPSIIERLTERFEAFEQERLVRERLKRNLSSQSFTEVAALQNREFQKQAVLIEKLTTDFKRLGYLDYHTQRPSA